MNEHDLDQRIARTAPLTDAELEQWNLAAPLSNLCEAIMSTTHPVPNIDEQSDRSNVDPNPGSDPMWSLFDTRTDHTEAPAVRSIGDDELRAHADRRRRITMALAGVASIAVLVAGLAFAVDRPTSPPVADAPTSAVPPVEGVFDAPPVCDDTGCTGLDALPVTEGLTDYYVGPESLGEPSSRPEDLRVPSTVPGAEDERVNSFDLIRCAELDAAGTTCTKLDAFSSFGGLVQYDTDVPVDTTGARTSTSFSIQIGTSWTDLTPAQFIASTVRPDIAVDDTRTVRGHPAVYTDFVSPTLVWQERPGVLVSIQVPTERENELDAIAENIVRVEGPATISSRVVVPGTGELFGPTGDAFNTLVIARGNGVECIGWAYAQTCATDIAAITFREFTSDGPAIIGATPSGVTTVRITPEGRIPTTVETQTFGTYQSRFYKYPVTDGTPITVEWLREDQTVVASIVTEPGPDELGLSEG